LKNLVGFMLESAGFTVVNLGVDVSAEAFAEAVREHKPQVLGMSGLGQPHLALVALVPEGPSRNRDSGFS
jgi:methanogenic corrinoid protein MtbC1